MEPDGAAPLEPSRFLPAPRQPAGLRGVAVPRLRRGVCVDEVEEEVRDLQGSRAAGVCAIGGQDAAEPNEAVAPWAQAVGPEVGAPAEPGRAPQGRGALDLALDESLHAEAARVRAGLGVEACGRIASVDAAARVHEPQVRESLLEDLRDRLEPALEELGVRERGARGARDGLLEPHGLDLGRRGPLRGEDAVHLARVVGARARDAARVVAADGPVHHSDARLLQGVGVREGDEARELRGGVARRRGVREAQAVARHREPREREPQGGVDLGALVAPIGVQAPLRALVGARAEGAQRHEARARPRAVRRRGARGQEGHGEEEERERCREGPLHWVHGLDRSPGSRTLPSQLGQG